MREHGAIDAIEQVVLLLLAKKYPAPEALGAKKLVELIEGNTAKTSSPWLSAGDNPLLPGVAHEWERTKKFIPEILVGMDREKLISFDGQRNETRANAFSSSWSFDLPEESRLDWVRQMVMEKELPALITLRGLRAFRRADSTFFTSASRDALGERTTTGAGATT